MGRTDDGNISVPYLLSVFGDLETGTNKPEIGELLLARMPTWELRVANEGNISCIGGGEFEDFVTDPMFIEATRTK